MCRLYLVFLAFSVLHVISSCSLFQINHCAILLLQGISKRRFISSICWALLILWGQLESRQASVQMSLSYRLHCDCISCSYASYFFLASEDFSVALIYFHTRCHLFYICAVCSWQFRALMLGPVLQHVKWDLKIDRESVWSLIISISFMSWPVDGSIQSAERQTQTLTKGESLDLLWLKRLHYIT